MVTEECILCRACIVGCESNAITEGETQAHIGTIVWVECGTCKINCPSEVKIFIDEDKLILFKHQVRISKNLSHKSKPFQINLLRI